MKLCIITASNDDASKVYVRNKIKACMAEGIEVKHINVKEDEISGTEYLPSGTACKFSTKLEAHGYAYHLTDVLHSANADEEVTGILLQLPLHEDIIKDTQYFIDLIKYEKDVDCLTRKRQGDIMLGSNDFLPCTTQGVLDMITANTEKTKNECVHVVGRSNLVTKPLIVALINAGYTVRNWNSTHTVIDEDVAHDLLTFSKVHFVSGAGCANLFDKEWYEWIEDSLNADLGHSRYLKENLYIYDIGMNRDDDGKLCGDVERGLNVVYQSPVPGGVGPKTIINLIENLKKL